ncbi:MAG TPA: 6-carboxytetrahydropterin synthase [Dehalococcoidia bacterium]
MTFSVRVEGIRFAAAHFATFKDGCEPLHGHSYEVAAEVQGGLAGDSWVLDFSELKAALRAVCEPLDHRFLLQAKTDKLRLEFSGAAWRVYGPAQTAYLFPAGDVVALPIDNSTAERLAEYLCGELGSRLAAAKYGNIVRLSVEVWEGPGQRGRFTQGRLPQE